MKLDMFTVSKITRYAYSTVKKVLPESFKDTVNLPKTKFPQYLNVKQIIERDARITEHCGFSEYYKWQRSHMKGEEFTLLDGPPYANGKPHIGHAINKILKDITLRSKLLQGLKVHFIPGWDCHGLPIELKALDEAKETLSPIEIRQRARKFALEASHIQKKAFRQFGVLGDWENQCYYTFEKSYVMMQIQVFFELYEKGLVFRDLKPVYWSPSSRSALAESELVYKEDHLSKAIILKLKVVNHPDLNDLSLPIWTTTPWTIPMNEAVCFCSNLKYSVVRIDGHKGSFLVGTTLVPELKEKLRKEIDIVREISGDEIKKLKYRHPWRKNDDVKPILESSHVTETGTGFVHTAPFHGHEDFLIGLKYKLNQECLVDEEGRYLSKAGESLEGMSVLKEGNLLVLEHLNKAIMHLEDYRHSYPYDWRTNEPVIIRGSWQWFINTEALKEEALESLKNVRVPSERLASLLKSRPYWCISRQRSWGVPIPVFYHKGSGRPLINKTTIDHICQLISTYDNADLWWAQPLLQLFPEKALSELFVTREDLVRGDDIMDIWLDSGLAWEAVLDGRCADLCLEGGDQYTGWFQSCLLTSVALTGEAPFRQILTHGFAVDETGRKMSKSLGNVVDPEVVLTGEKAFGIDALRWWVATQGHHPQIGVSERILQENKEAVQRIRLVLRFLLGALNGITEEELVSGENHLNYLDRYILDLSHSVFNNFLDCYNQYEFHKVCKQLLHFVSDSVSSLYLHVVKDRLYCDAVTSEKRKAARVVLYGLLETLTHSIAPVLPHLAEEVYIYHPLDKGERFFYRSNMWRPPVWWKNEGINEVFAVPLEIKRQIDVLAGPSGGAKSTCFLKVNEELLNILKNFQESNSSPDSQLTELFQVSTVALQKTENSAEELEIVLEDTRCYKCPRCRRFTAEMNMYLCKRCQQVVSLQ